ncbi:MAG: hypothetical protein AB1401_12605 [Thermodesulfobacteriota bacterium]
MKKVRLKDLAYARSGDKGDVSNIGLMAFNKENYKIIKREVTPEKVKKHFKGMVKGDVKIYEMPNLDSLEIVLYNALGGGATRTLRLDQTGKSMGQALLWMEVEVE